MNTDFKIKSLSLDEFEPYFALSDKELSNIDAKRIVVDESPYYPCRVSLKDAKIGESVIALSYCFHDAGSIYKASGPIFIRENANNANLLINEIPTMLLHRLLSVRAYNYDGFMMDADTVEGIDLIMTIKRFFLDSKISYLHIHNAKPGCFNCEVKRVTQV